VSLGNESTPTFEQKLSAEERREREQEHMKRKTNFRSLKNLFMDQQDSASRHRKVMKHHKKLRQKSYGYSYLAHESPLSPIGGMDADDAECGRIDFHDFEYTDDYLDHNEMMLRTKSNVSNLSNLSNLSNMSSGTSLRNLDSLRTTDDFKQSKSPTTEDIVEGDIEQKDEETLDDGQILEDWRPSMYKRSVSEPGMIKRSVLSIEMPGNIAIRKTTTQSASFKSCMSSDAFPGLRKRETNVLHENSGKPDTTQTASRKEFKTHPE